MLNQVKVQGEYIKLDQLLKVAEAVDSGGQAKIYILNGEVKVNGEVSTQRGKKIRVGDIVEFQGSKIKVV
ncbi:MAG: S4 domain-containing protein YaaA [Clostridiaceae bacterium]|nr:S4 domain-containing protein YaaA [Clostridiaceae bacterium]